MWCLQDSGHREWENLKQYFEMGQAKKYSLQLIGVLFYKPDSYQMQGCPVSSGGENMEQKRLE